MERLLDAAHALTGLPAGSSDWVAFGGPVPSGDTPDYERQAQRAVRCLAVMQQLVEEWQVWPPFCPLQSCQMLSRDLQR